LIRFDTQISDINTLKSSVEGGIKCEHCGIELMNAAITNAKITELDGYIHQKDEKTKLMNDLSIKEHGFVKLKKDFDVYEKNKLIFDKLEITRESLELKIGQLKNNLIEFNKIEEKIGHNKQIEQLIIKSTLRLDELEQEKLNYNKEISINETRIINNKEKVTKNLNLIIQINEEFQKERIYKVYLELFGKNGVSKLIMKSMIPLINSELQRLLEDSSYFRLEIRISDKNEVEFWMIDNGTGIEKLMVSGSGYERTIASLALRAVLSKICSLPKPNIIVMDEVFGKISNENLDMVGEFFQKIKGYFEKIFVITHNPLVLNWSDTILRVRKENNISKVIQ
jgi:DNA repair protein SbcC/Rad50